ncbi:Type III restriction enzyme, res subunit [Gallaecimonas xiamenensis 3-C-1]|uniref:Type III restriction enzyme, res subunit n=2 Tax=Gallaecimonas TaxID=745410 RepID=K2JYD4_9GAMM|nr:Type III restriction enzyme, res subunit [Gallaecimonas xiamenensis 3-C-1]
MACLIIAGKFDTTLIVVPSDSLRTQISEKLKSLSLLRKIGVIKKEILSPRVGLIKSRIKKEEISDLLSNNVLISTAQALSSLDSETLAELLANVTHLIFDEAHHVEATSWKRIKKTHGKKPCFQFTATPYRADKKKIEGRIVYSYSIKKAQEDNYFKKIEFHPVYEFIKEKSHQAIADKAIEILKADLKNGLDHILMARTASIKEAKKVFAFYEKSKELKPILVHSKLSNIKEILERVKQLEHKIIVCVDMLGEGFDLPNLKIAAIHDTHKSPNITLQFVGRFTRTNNPKIGNAKFICNIADDSVEEQLKRLYREDSNWNEAIQIIGDNNITKELTEQDFKAEFHSEERKLLNLGLKVNSSTLLFSVNDKDVDFDKLDNFPRNNQRITYKSINNSESIAMFVTESEEQVKWANADDVKDRIKDLYVIHYNRKIGLLYINASSSDSEAKRLAKLVSKNDKPLSGEMMFRSLHDIKRLKLNNVGLNKNNRNIKFQMHVGSDIQEILNQIKTAGTKKSNIFGQGYFNGLPQTMGCSHRGKIWSMEQTTIQEWIAWCNIVGRKVLNNKINTDDIIKNALRAKYITNYSKANVIAIDWPSTVFLRDVEKVKLELNNIAYNAIQCSFSDISKNKDGSIQFNLYLEDDKKIKVKQEIKNERVTIECTPEATISFGRTTTNLSSFLEDDYLTLFDADLSIIEGDTNYYIEGGYNISFDKNKLEYWDWTGVDISTESQKRIKIPNSIQRKVIESQLKKYDIVFDDDGSGEVADVVAIKKLGEDKYHIDLFHCKYCPKNSKPGSRVDDFYQVLGQLVKSVKWIPKAEKILDKLLSSENIASGNGYTRIEKGDITQIGELKNKARHIDFSYGLKIVQPALSKASASDDVLSLIGSATEYVKEIADCETDVICSP